MMIRYFGFRLVFCTLAFACMIGGADTVSAQGDCGCSLAGGVSTISMKGFSPAWDVTWADSIYLTVNVPEDAAIFVNGDPTAMGGTARYFVIRHLDSEREYKFEISAVRPNAAGILLEQKTTVVLRAGQRHTLSLDPYERKIEPKYLEKERAAADALEVQSTPADAELAPAI